MQGVTHKIRKWIIPDRELAELRVPKDGAIGFLRSIGVNTNLRLENYQDPFTARTVLTQRTPIKNPDEPDRTEREILNSIIEDEEMWVYEPAAAMGGATLSVAELPPLKMMDPCDPNESIPMPKVRRFDIQEMKLVRNFEHVSLMVAVDPDSLQVYWARKNN